jgi:ABC-type branched-subunit amino acid transport system substrate-binding protein
MTTGVLVVAAALAAAMAASATGTPTQANVFKVMFITVAGAPTGDNSDGVAGAQAAAAAINKAGGLKGGVKIQVDFCNDNNTPTGAVDCARKAVQENYDNVMVSNSFTPNTNPILDAANIPQIGTLPVAPADFFDKNIVAIDAPTVSYYSAPLIYLAQQKKAKRAAIVSLQLASTLTIAAAQKAAIRALGPKYGATYLGTISVPLTQTDFSTVVQQLKGSNPQVVMLNLTAAQAIAFYKAADQLGLNAQIAASATVVKDNILEQLPNGGTGIWLGSPFPPYDSAGLPGLRQFVSQMQDAGFTDAVKYYGPVGIRWWLNTWALQKLSQTVSGPVTKQSMLDAAKKAKGINLYGLESWNPSVKGPAAYPNSPNGTVYVLQAVNGKGKLVSPKPIDFYRVTGLLK